MDCFYVFEYLMLLRIRRFSVIINENLRLQSIKNVTKHNSGRENYTVINKILPIFTV